MSDINIILSRVMTRNKWIICQFKITLILSVRGKILVGGRIFIFLQMYLWIPLQPRDCPCLLGTKIFSYQPGTSYSSLNGRRQSTPLLDTGSRHCIMNAKYVSYKLSRSLVIDSVTRTEEINFGFDTAFLYHLPKCPRKRVSTSSQKLLELIISHYPSTLWTRWII